MKSIANATLCDNPLRRAELTVPQENAVDALAIGKNDAETASIVGVHRVTVTRWRLYDPVFQAALNVRRAEVWAVGVHRLRSLIPKALDVLAEELEDEDNPDRLKVALELLKLCPPAMPNPNTPIDADEIVRRIVDDRRAKAPGSIDAFLANVQGLPPLEVHVREVWAELTAKLDGRQTDVSETE